ncbi:type IV secretory system conjugative DNA transfer family protein [Kineococcus endophyticus]|uniref:Type IV secretory system conjugative DNA transfer family protein n=1 Tax=Kineococcus endophyticus TaxID=1181883 RepID=A0ABV3PEC9_9ACTN
MSNHQWGPQGYAYPGQEVRRSPRLEPTTWRLVLIYSATLIPLAGLTGSPSLSVFIVSYYLLPLTGWAVFPLLLGVIAGCWHRYRRRYVPLRRLATRRGILLGPAGAIAYIAGYTLVGLPWSEYGQWVRRGRSQRRSASTPLSATAQPTSSAAQTPGPALARVRALAAEEHGRAGAHMGWSAGRYLSANPRGGVLVIGPPGSGKTSAFLIPSVIVAPGACVASSIKGDVMEATAPARAQLGTVWHFDPGGDVSAAPGVRTVRWSPLVSIQSWEDARRMADRMAAAMRPEGGEGNGAHFTDRARDWLEVLLYAAVIGGEYIGTVADWAATATDMDKDGTVETVLSHLERSAASGDQGARIASTQLQGLLAIDDRERSGVLSSLQRMLRLYGSVAARDLGRSPNFDPARFVRSRSTLYITASPDKQQAYAPLLASLLEEIRFATYARHRAEEVGKERKHFHVTFVLDEANNTAPIPLPAIISEAGGQSLHVVVGIQDLSRARSRWGRDADGFLTLFPSKIILPGCVEPYTLDALSNAAGEYDREMVSYSESVTPLKTFPWAVRQQNPTYSTQRQRVLHQGDIANIPKGKALRFEGARWALVEAGMHWQHPVWRSAMGKQ